MSKGYSKEFMLVQSGYREQSDDVVLRIEDELHIKLNELVASEYLNQQLVVVVKVRLAKEGELEGEPS